MMIRNALRYFIKKAKFIRVSALMTPDAIPILKKVLFGYGAGLLHRCQQIKTDGPFI